MRTTSRREVMKTALLGALAAGFGIHTTSAAAQQVSGSGKVLVVYFSRSGNTRTVARHIRRIRGASLFEIEPAQPYPEDYEATVAQAKNETDRGYEPPLKELVPDVGSYDVVFLAFPVWGTTAPPVIRSFLSKHDLSGRDSCAGHHAWRLWPRLEHAGARQACAACAHCGGLHHAGAAGAANRRSSRAVAEQCGHQTVTATLMACAKHSAEERGKQ